MELMDHARGGLIALALVANGIAGLPDPGATTEAEVAQRWTTVAPALTRGLRGVGVAPADVHRGIAQAATRYHAVHSVLERPFRPFFRLTGTDQSWALFAAGSARRDRLVVEIQRDARSAWTPIERRLDPCCTWRDDQFRYRRIRGLWDGLEAEARPGYVNLAKWAARHAFSDYPDAVAVRVVVERSDAHLPWMPPKPRTRRVHPTEFRRDTPGDLELSP